MWRGSPSYGVRSGVTMSQNIRATPCSAGRHGSTLNVSGSGIAIMSDSSIGLKPVIEDPSNPIPPSNASDSSVALIENALSWPRMSVNQRRMKRMSRSETSEMTSSAVRWRDVAVIERGTLLAASREGGKSGADGLAASAEPAVGPRLELDERGLELGAHLRQRVLDPQGRSGNHRPLDDAARLELLHALGQQAVRQLGHGLSDLREAQRAVHQDAQDRSGPPSPPHIHGLVG